MSFMQGNYVNWSDNLKMSLVGQYRCTSSCESSCNYVNNVFRLVEGFLLFFFGLASLLLGLWVMVTFSILVSSFILIMFAIVIRSIRMRLVNKSFKCPNLIRSSILSFRTSHSFVECPLLWWYWHHLEKSTFSWLLDLFGITKISVAKAWSKM